MEASLSSSGATLTAKTIVLIRTGRDRYIEEKDYWKRGTGMSAEATEWLPHRRRLGCARRVVAFVPSTEDIAERALG